MASFTEVIASSALIALAITGDPVPLQKELGGEIVASNVIPASAVLEGDEYLFPGALKLEDGAIVAKIASDVDKDNFVVFENGEVMRLDVGNSEGTNIPFLIEQEVPDNTSIWRRSWNWTKEKSKNAYYKVRGWFDWS